MTKGRAFVSLFDFKHFKTSKSLPVLLETEGVFRNRLTMPAEEEQYRLYRSIIGTGIGSPLIATLFDWSGEKAFSQSLLPPELKNLEGIDGFSLWKEHPSFLCSQVRALLRASYDSSIWILAPKVRRPEELTFLCHLLEEVLTDLGKGKGPFDRYPKLGVRLDSLISLTQVEKFSQADFFVVDLDRLAFHFFGLCTFPESLRSILLRELSLEKLMDKLPPFLFEEKWWAMVSRFPPEEWGSLAQLPIEVYFERFSGDI